MTISTSDTDWKEIVGRQFLAAIAMLENALRACPQEIWSASLWHDPAEPPQAAQFWYLIYHTLFWVDLYLSGAVEGFTPPAPFTLAELDPAGVYPERPYTRDELQGYLEHGREKCRTVIETLTDEQARRPCTFTWGQVTFAELLLDNMRHVQEHTAQLNLFLGQQIRWAPRWVAKTQDN
jgi:hypothetical protein